MSKKVTLELDTERGGYMLQRDGDERIFVFKFWSDVLKELDRVFRAKENV